MKTASYSYGKKPIKADVSGLRETPKDAFRKNGFYLELAVIDPATGRTIVTARFTGPGSTVYCDVWLYQRKTESGMANRSGRGRAMAGGYGYHKASAALGSAIADAGVTLSQRINGVGDSAMEEAVMAVAKALSGKRRLILHRAHA